MKICIGLGVMLLAAILEVGGDAMIRAGLRGKTPTWIGVGCVGLAGYGVVVNLLPIDFSRLLASYIGFFAIVSIAFGRIAFSESIAPSTWIGVAVILVGSAIVQSGHWR